MVFTGLVSAQGTGGFINTEQETACWRLSITSKGYFKDVKLGDSIAVNGVCLTVVCFTEDTAGFDVMVETRNLTSLEGRPVYNLEKAMSASDRLGGHVVQGHVHGVGTIESIDSSTGDDSTNFWITHPPVGTDQVIEHKGSITIDGVSLTVAEVKDSRVRVSIIPHTKAVTTFGSYKVNDNVNIEFCNRSKVEAAVPTTDSDFMKLAIEQGDKGRCTAPPNPWVGSVIVSESGQVIGKGFHKKAGTAHAEVVAIASVSEYDKDKLATSTLYCTLEPCSHHGRTGPCCEAVVKSGVKRCVVAVLDPDTKVSGRGIKYLQEHGVETIVGVELEAAEASLAPYLFQRRNERPYCVLKIATTLDGYVACSDGTSQWITGPKARAYGHKIRSESQAVIVGSQTALSDNPQLTVRDDGVERPFEQQPWRVLLDHRGRVSEGHLFSDKAPTIIFTESMDSNYPKPQSETFKVQRGPFTISSVLSHLKDMGILQVMVEGGGSLHTSFMSEGLCDRLYVFQGPTFFGDGKKWLTRSICSTIKDAKFMKLESVEQLDNDIKMEYILNK
eukprot:TRINITY_DN1723_c1_g1_i1.p1 TRINITY_DN1723_c1_g1~~TRINITY_DN1723_c1_g1_i1.p1  ORF type:complete len:558 (+),score=122.39 TRINITY_DN1723_c1_g1_i1:109-1782(+)